MDKGKSIDDLVKFRYVDKYESFYRIMPAIRHAPEYQKQVVSALLDECCAELIRLLGEPGTKKAELKLVLYNCMDNLSCAQVDSENREFGYQLGYYLAEKAGVDLRRGSDRKVWGYWKVNGGKVVPVSYARPRKREAGTNSGDIQQEVPT